MKSETDLIISRNLQRIFSDLGDELSDLTHGKHIGLSLVIFNHEENSRLNYISNIERTEVIKVWETLLDGWSKGMPDVPAHEYKS